jgi:hypothetical protein
VIKVVCCLPQALIGVLTEVRVTSQTGDGARPSSATRAVTNSGSNRSRRRVGRRAVVDGLGMSVTGGKAQRRGEPANGIVLLSHTMFLQRRRHHISANTGCKAQTHAGPMAPVRMNAPATGTACDVRAAAARARIERAATRVMVAPSGRPELARVSIGAGQAKYIMMYARSTRPRAEDLPGVADAGGPTPGRLSLIASKRPGRVVP